MHAYPDSRLHSWLLTALYQIHIKRTDLFLTPASFLTLTRHEHQDSAINLAAFPFQTATMRFITGSEESPLHDLRCEVVQYSRRRTIACPNPSSAAILLTFALKDAVPLQIPPNLPESRVVATATQRSGPTMEDYRIVNTIRTPLFSDTWSCIPSSHDAGAPQDPHRSLQYDQYFYRMVLEPPIVQPKLERYIPGSLTATWEGTYMVRFVLTHLLTQFKSCPKISPLVLPNVNVPSSSSDTRDFICRRPIQCALREYFRSTHIPFGGHCDTKTVRTATSLVSYECSSLSSER